MSLAQDFLDLTEKLIRKEDLKSTGLGDIKGISPGAKDVARMEDIVTKSGMDHKKIMQLVKNMAKSIKQVDKAQRRAAAALEVLTPEYGAKFAREAAQEFLAKF